MSFVRSSRSRRRRGINGAAAAAEALEPRRLLAVTPVGPEFRVNTAPNLGGHSSAAAAADADGDFVVAWNSFSQDGDGFGVFARVYDAAGNPRTGELAVNTFTAGAQGFPAVAMDADGDFVVAWQGEGDDGAGYGVYARRFTAFGQPRGAEFRVNTSTAGDEEAPAVAMDAAGNFVVVWQASATLTLGEPRDVRGQRYDADGARQGGEFTVNAATAGTQTRPDVAMDAAGEFVVAWQSSGHDVSGTAGIFARRFDAAGAALGGGEVRVDVASPGVSVPAVAADADGDFVVAWQSLAPNFNVDVFARRFNAAGAPQGGEFVVNVAADGSQFAPDAAMDADGDFVVAWASQTGSIETGFTYGIYTRRFNAAGAAQGGDEQANTAFAGSRSEPGVASDPEGDLVVAWHGAGVELDAAVNARRYDESTDTAPPAVAAIVGGGDPVRADERLVQSLPTLVVGFSQNVSVDGGATGDNSATNPANYRLTRNGVDVSSQIASVTYGTDAQTGKHEASLVLSAALGDGDYQLAVRGNLRDTAAAPGNALDGDFDGAAGGDFSRAFTVALPVKAGPEFLVNTTTARRQEFPAVAADADGDFVVVWRGLSANLTEDIYMRRYDAAGVPKGDEVRVSTPVGAEGDVDPAVAMDADGDFVVAWTKDHSPYTDDNDIFARRYNAAGEPQGGEFRVNTVNVQQGSAVVAADADGDFVIVWQSGGQDGAGYGIYGQRFGAAGQARGGEFQVNQATALDQFQPTVAMDADGDFVVAWTSDDPAATGNDDVFARRHSAAGVALGGEFRVNAPDAFNQNLPSAAMDADGDFVIAWTDEAGDTTADAVFARRFDADGRTEGDPFRVSPVASPFATFPSAAMDADGDFVVAWNDFLDADQGGVYAQRYGAGGARSGAEFRVNTTTALAQTAGAVALDADGDFVVAWHSRDQDGDDLGVYAQRFAAEPPPRVAGVFVDGTAWAPDFRAALLAAGLGSASLGFRVDGGAAQLDEIPWANVDRVHVVFSDDVLVDAADLAVRGVNVPTYAFAANNAFAYNPATFTATWTLAAPVAADKVLLDLNADAGGVTDKLATPRALDGEWTNGSPSQAFPSGDGTVGGDFRFQFNVLPGDVNRNGGVVNSIDVQQVRLRQFTGPDAPGTPPNTYSPFFDVNGSGGIVNSIDVQQVRIRQFSQLPSGNPTVVAMSRRMVLFSTVRRNDDWEDLIR